jgi:hypothetical protein
MAYHPRIECREIPSFQTSRARNSELWFVNKPELENAILGYAARYSTRYEVKLYALAVEGNHIQKVAGFPKGNRAYFMRDFNSAVARAVPRYQSDYSGGDSGPVATRQSIWSDPTTLRIGFFIPYYSP